MRHAIDCSVTLFALAGMSAVMVAKIFKMPPFLLMFVMGFAVWLLPLPMIFSLGTDVLTLSIVIGGFLGALIGKPFLQLFHKFWDRHTNYDEIAKRQANVFGVQPGQVKRLHSAFIKLGEKLKAASNFWMKLNGAEKLEKYALVNDSQFLLFNAKTKEEIESFKALLSKDEPPDFKTSSYYYLFQNYLPSYNKFFDEKESEEFNEVYKGASWLERMSASTNLSFLWVHSNVYSPTERGYNLKNRLQSVYWMTGLGKVKAFGKLYKDQEATEAVDEYQEAIKPFLPA